LRLLPALPSPDRPEDCPFPLPLPEPLVVVELCCVVVVGVVELVEEPCDGFEA
jgi:hypothetical protein